MPSPFVSECNEIDRIALLPLRKKKQQLYKQKYVNSRPIANHMPDYEEVKRHVYHVVRYITFLKLRVVCDILTYTINGFLKLSVRCTVHTHSETKTKNAAHILY